MDQNQYYQQPLPSNGSSAQGPQDNAKLPIMTGELEYRHRMAAPAQTDISYGRPPGRTPHPLPTSQISADRGAELPLVATDLTEPQPRYRPAPQQNGHPRVDAAYQRMTPMDNGRVESPPSAHDHAARPATVVQVPTPYQGQSPYGQHQPQFSRPMDQTQQYQWEERPQHLQSQRQARTNLWQQDQQVQALEEPRLQQQFGAMQRMPQQSCIMPPYMLSQPTQSTHPSNPISPDQHQDVSHGIVSASQAQQPVQQQAQQQVRLSAQHCAQQLAAAQKARLFDENPESREWAEQNREALARFDRFLRECNPFVEMLAEFKGIDDWAELVAVNAVAAMNQRTMAAEQMQQAQKSPYIKRLARQLPLYLEIKERMPSTTPRDCLVTIALRVLEQIGIPFMLHQQDQRALQRPCARPDAVTGKRVIDVTDVQEDAGNTSAALPIPVQARNMEQRRGVNPVTWPSIFKQPSTINQAALQNKLYLLAPAPLVAPPVQPKPAPSLEPEQNVLLTAPAAEYIWLEEELAQIDAVLAGFAEDERKDAEAAERQAKTAQTSQQPQPSSSQPKFHNSSATPPTPEHLRAQRFHRPSYINPAYIFPSEAEIRARLAAPLARQDEAGSFSPLPPDEATLAEAQMLMDFAQAGSSALGKRKHGMGEAEDQPCADGTPEAGGVEVEFDDDSVLDVGDRLGMEDGFARTAREREEMESTAWIEDLSEDMEVETGQTSGMVW